MLLEIQETVLFYEKSLLESWKNGDKGMTPEFVLNRSTFLAQPNYHFGEIFVLRQYQYGGWRGVISYALGFPQPRSEARAYGKKIVESVIPPHKLTQLRNLRGKSWETDFGTGEPDLFLYKESGEYKFGEVKKQSDRIRQPQLKCLAQIAAVLGCPVEIIYLCEKGRTHTPKTYIRHYR